MKKFPAILLLFYVLAGCNKELVFETKTYLKKTSIECPQQCPQVSVIVPIASDGTAADSINASVFNSVTGILSFGEKPFQAKNYSDLLNSFIGTYEKMQNDSPDELFGWEGDIKGRVVYESDQVLNIELRHYTFTGGAHGYGGLRSLLFNPETGKTIRIFEIFADVKGFTRFAEQEFRKKFRISATVPVNSAGLMFEKDKFHLPQNIFFTEEGLLLYYNAYEIASYAEGAKELLIPYDKAAPFLALR